MNLHVSLAQPTKDKLCPKMRHPEQALEIGCNEKLRTFFKKKSKLLNSVLLCQERPNLPAVGFH